MDESRNVPASNRFGRRQKTFLKFSVRPNGFSAIVPSLEARFSLVPGGHRRVERRIGDALAARS